MAAAATATTVLRISGMPVRLRPVVEDLMARVIESESEFVVPGDDPLTAQWCTRWHKDYPGDNIVALADGRATGTPCGVGCRQVLTGTREELTDFAAELSQLAGAYGFSAQLEGFEDVAG